MDVSIVIVSYNTCLLTVQCLKSLYDYTKDVEFEIILVDNASVDDTVYTVRRNYPNVKVIESNKNLGFGRANNLGAKNALGKYLFLLNSDTKLIDNIIFNFFHFMERNPQFAACGGNLLDGEGKETIAHGKFPSLLQEFSDIGFAKLYYSWYKNNLSCSQKASWGDINPVDYLSGADVFIRSAIFHEIGGFDSQFFMYYEETDLFFQMKKKGYCACLLPDSRLVHLEGGSCGNLNTFSMRRFKMHFKSKILYFRKNGTFFASFIVRIFTLISVWTHFYRHYDYLMEMSKVVIQTKLKR